jgi:hypothetical protein
MSIGKILSRVVFMALSVALLAVVILSMSHIAYEMSFSAHVRPGFEELLTFAHSRVQAVAQPNAFGHGVPLIKDSLSFVDSLHWIGLLAGMSVAATLAIRLSSPELRYGIIGA